MEQDHHEVLGIPDDSGKTANWAAYKAQMRWNHPAFNPGQQVASATGASIRLAYGLLSDPAGRARHDRERHLGKQNSHLDGTQEPQFQNGRHANAGTHGCPESNVQDSGQGRGDRDRGRSGPSLSYNFSWITWRRWLTVIPFIGVLRIPAVVIGIGIVLFANGTSMLDTAAMKYIATVVVLAPVVALGVRRIARNPPRKRGILGFLITGVSLLLSVVSVCMALATSLLPALLSLVGLGVAIFGVHTGRTSGSFTSRRA